MSVLEVPEAPARPARRPRLRLLDQGWTPVTRSDWVEPRESPRRVASADRTPTLLNASDPWLDVVREGVVEVNERLSSAFAGYAGLAIQHGELDPGNVFLNSAAATRALDLTPLQLPTAHLEAAFAALRASQVELVLPVAPLLDSSAMRSISETIAAAIASSARAVALIASASAPALDTLASARLGELLANSSASAEKAVAIAERASVLTGVGAAEPDNDLDPAEDDPPAFSAFCDLRKWLLLNADEAAEIVGVGRTTPYTWKREKREPQAANARRLYQVHALVEALVQRVGDSATRNWLNSGEPSALDLIRAGEVEAATNAAQALIFGAPAAVIEPGGLVEDASEAEVEPAADEHARPRTRQATARRFSLRSK